MKNNSKRALAVWTFILSLPATVVAQTSGNFTNLKVGEANGFQGDGTIISGGSLYTPLPSGVPASPLLSASAQTAGTRLLWYPRKAAFRAGLGSAQSNGDASIGICSAAIGRWCVASGDSSFSTGMANTASGGYSTVIGGNSNTASGTFSSAMGQYSTASGYLSIAIGESNNASGYCSRAMGRGSVASAFHSTAIGEFVLANSGNAVAIGRYNVGLGSNDWIATESLFEIGNGSPSWSEEDYEVDGNGDGDMYDLIPVVRSNALTVYKNGDMDVQGNLNVGGEILSGGKIILTESSNPPAVWSNTFVSRGDVSNGGLLALGTSVSSGAESFAIGSSSANSLNEIAVGRFNKVEPTASATAWQETDVLFRVGNGSSATETSDAITTLKNGETTLTNKAWDAGAPLDDPAPASDSSGNALVVDGHAVLNGKVVISVPQGDISMGIYGGN